MRSDTKKELVTIANLLNRKIQDESENIVRHYENVGDVQCYQVEMKRYKPIIDKIDELLAKHYGFTEEELDFIINYDIKYRMGDRLNGED